MAGRHEADVLAIWLVRRDEPVLARDLADAALRQFSQRKPDHRQLRRRGAVEKIALVARGVGAAKQAAPAVRERARRAVMTGRQRIGAKVARGLQKVGELHGIVARGAGYGRLARRVARDERVDHRPPEAGLVVEHVMGNAEPRRDGARVVDVAPGAAGALASRRALVAVEPQRDADDIVALVLEERRDDGGVRRRPTSRRRRGWRMATGRNRDCSHGGPVQFRAPKSGVLALISLALSIAARRGFAASARLLCQSEHNLSDVDSLARLDGAPRGLSCKSRRLV